MTEPQPQDYSHEPDLPPDTITEIESLEEEEPVQLEGGSDDADTWPKPLDDWDIEANDEEYHDDPDVTVGEDNTQDWPPEPLISTETPI